MFSKSEMVELHWLIWKVKERLEKVGLDFNLTEYKDYGVSPWNHSISKEDHHHAINLLTKAIVSKTMVKTTWVIGYAWKTRIKKCVKWRNTEGGTYVLGGTERAELNVTYNYTSFFHDALDKELGIRWLYHRQGKECIERLEKAVNALGTERDDDYWASTPGNAGYALSILLSWTRKCPDCFFKGD